MPIDYSILTRFVICETNEKSFEKKEENLMNLPGRFANANNKSSLMLELVI